MYESPITIMYKDIANKTEERLEGCIVTTIQECGIDVDKDELIKALKYDREQYKKGYAEGHANRDSEIIRCKDCKFYGRADKRRFYRGMDCLNSHIATIVPDMDFCSKAERRTDG